MGNLEIILIILFVLSLVINYKYTSSSLTAYQTVKNMGIGYNLANTFDNFNSEINNPMDQITLMGNKFPTNKLIKNIKKYGFKTIRLPVTWIQFLDDLGNIDTSWMSLVKNVVNLIIKNNLYCILNVYNDGKGDNWLSNGLFAKDKYINLWTQIAEEFKNYNEYLIFESMDETVFYSEGLIYDYSTYNKFSQIFVDTIRSAKNFNKQRLLIISGINSNLAYTCENDFQMPIDPYNKLALSLHYYYPNYFVNSGTINEWGDDFDFDEMLENFDMIKEYFLDKGFPVILTEIGVNTEEDREINSFRFYFHSVFSISLEYGMVPCLWDTSNKMYGNKNYYNRETDEWYDEKIKEIFFLISKGKHIKPSDHYIITNKLINLNDYNFKSFDILVMNRHPINMIINAFIKGKIKETISKVYLYCYSINDDYYSIKFGMKDIKKQYDGTSIINIDLRDYDCSYIIYLLTFSNNEYITFNNITVEFKETFKFFNYTSFKSAFLNNINKNNK